jgi:imidazole glycerol phosphate synthase glutamine amidotransferase subunit
MITVIDYGGGNLASLEGALDAFGLAHRRAATPAQAAARGLLVLPGDGHFATARAGLAAGGWWDALPALVAAGRPLLGICVGLQLLAEASEEAPGSSGLGLLPGTVRRLGPGVKVPHLGWSKALTVCAHAALDGVAEPWLYFVHSYALEVNAATLLAAEHGRPFAAAAAAGRVLGFQPHPEKSGPGGRALLQGAIRWLQAQEDAP